MQVRFLVDVYQDHRGTFVASDIRPKREVADYHWDGENEVPVYSKDHPTRNLPNPPKFSAGQLVEFGPAMARKYIEKGWAVDASDSQQTKAAHSPGH